MLVNAPRHMGYEISCAFVLSILLASSLGCDSGVNNLLPEVPTMVSPQDGSENESDAVEIQWNSSASADAYQLQVSTDAGFSNTLVDESVLSSISYTLDGLQFGKTYYWHVRAKNEAGFSDWSPTWSFNPQQEAVLPDIPGLTIPSDGAINQPTTIVFKWQDSPGASTYHIQVSLESNFLRRVADLEGVRGTSQRVVQLIPTYIYFWRVRANNPLGYSSWSPTWKLVVEDAG